MAWYDVHVKQQAGIEFVVANKESVMNIHKRLKNVCSVNGIDKSTFGCWALLITGSEKGQVELSDACHSGWSTEGVTLVDIMPHGQTINSDVYSQTLKTLQK